MSKYSRSVCVCDGKEKQLVSWLIEVESSMLISSERAQVSGFSITASA